MWFLCFFVLTLGDSSFIETDIELSFKEFKYTKINEFLERTVLGPVALHELLHSYYIGHTDEDKDPPNIMSPTTGGQDMVFLDEHISYLQCLLENSE